MVTIDREVAVETPPHFTEGAFMHKRGSTYYLSYSSGSYRHDSYQVHYATAPSPTAPWTYRGQIVERDARSKGPGHQARKSVGKGRDESVRVDPGGRRMFKQQNKKK